MEESCEEEFNHGYDAGKQYCIDNPSACSIDVAVGSSAEFNTSTKILTIPSLIINDESEYAIDLKQVGPGKFILQNAIPK